MASTAVFRLSQSLSDWYSPQYYSSQPLAFTVPYPFRVDSPVNGSYRPNGLENPLGRLELFDAAVGGGVMLRGFGGVMLSLHMMTMRQMGMVAGLLVITVFMMLSGGMVVLGSLFMVLGCVAMMIGVFLRHGKSFRSG